MIRFLSIFIFIFLSTAANAHQTSTSFIKLENYNGKTTGLWQASISSLNSINTLDSNNNAAVSWLEVKNNKTILYSILEQALVIKNKNKRCAVSSFKKQTMEVEKILDEFYINLAFGVDCRVKDITSIEYDYYMKYDNDHKGIVTFPSANNQTDVYMTSANKRIIEVNSKSNKEFLNIVKEGVWHIWIGFDHVIFVLTLILGVMLRQRNIETENNSSVGEIIKVVTAFTLAHSITLGLAAFEIVELPVRIVESFIALTLIFAAVHNVQSQLPKNFNFLFSVPLWKMAFVFGLIHGFGFANVLGELNLASADIALSLFAFNLGVEIGQIVIVFAVAVLVAWLLSNKFFKNNVLTKILPVTSGLVICLGSIWVIERSFNIAVF